MAAERVSPHHLFNQLETPLVLSLIAAGVDELSRVVGGYLVDRVALSGAHPMPQLLLSCLYKHQVQDHE
jgi:hypothetical protein